MKKWTEEEAEQARGILTQFNGAAELAAVMGCDESDLDALCRGAFDLEFEEARETFAAQGRALLRRALWQQAQEGNTKALDMLAREQLGLGAVEQRRRNAQREAKADAGPAEDARPGTLKLLQGRRKDRRARAAG